MLEPQRSRLLNRPISRSPCPATSSLRHRTYIPLPSTLSRPFVRRSPICYVAFQAFRMDTKVTRSILVVFGRVFRATISRGDRKERIKRSYIAVKKDRLVSPHRCDLKDLLSLKRTLTSRRFSSSGSSPTSFSYHCPRRFLSDSSR